MFNFEIWEILQSSFTTGLYYHESCLIKLTLEKWNRTEQLLDCEANSKYFANGGICDIALQSKDPLISRKTIWIVSALKESWLTNRTILSSLCGLSLRSILSFKFASVDHFLWENNHSDRQNSYKDYKYLFIQINTFREKKPLKTRNFINIESFSRNRKLNV